MNILPLRDDLELYIDRHQLRKKVEQAKTFVRAELTASKPSHRAFGAA